MRDLFFFIKEVQKVHHRLDALEEQQQKVCPSPLSTNLSHEKKENPLYQAISLLSKSSSMLAYDEPIYDDDTHGVKNSLTIKRVNVLASFGLATKVFRYLMPNIC